VSGARVERSVLSPGVRVGEGAAIVESILFDDVVVGPGAKIRRAVIDEGMEIPAGYEIGYDAEADAKRFVVGPGGITVVPASAVLH
jgi:glucose-1-phosphate adenylyltransferase